MMSLVGSNPEIIFGAGFFFSCEIFIFYYFWFQFCYVCVSFRNILHMSIQKLFFFFFGYLDKQDIVHKAKEKRRKERKLDCKNPLNVGIFGTNFICNFLFGLHFSYFLGGSLSQPTSLLLFGFFSYIFQTLIFIFIFFKYMLINGKPKNPFWFRSKKLKNEIGKGIQFIRFISFYANGTHRPGSKQKQTHFSD